MRNLIVCIAFITSFSALSFDTLVCEGYQDGQISSSPIANSIKESKIQPNGRTEYFNHSEFQTTNLDGVKSNYKYTVTISKILIAPREFAKNLRELSLLIENLDTGVLALTNYKMDQRNIDYLSLSLLGGENDISLQCHRK